MSLAGDAGAALRGMARLLARPVRKARGRQGVVLQTYRGYGSADRVFVIGRAFWQSTDQPVEASEYRDILRRIRRRPVRGARILARFQGAVAEVETDQDGYFRVDMAPGGPLPPGRWHQMELAMTAPARLAAVADVYVPPAESRFVVVSDIDDTVMHTGVVNKVAMLWHLFVSDAEDRTVFPGVSHLYRALHAGLSDEGNPMLYVSRAPWGIYSILEEFFHRHDIPEGPVLFLREWGISWRSPLPRRAADHKQILIDAMMTLYADKPFVLIGDSGQHDPEIYREITARHPGRVIAIYIRDVVARGPERQAEIRAMSEAVAQAGAHLVLAPDSAAIAADAAGLGLISEAAARSVADRVAERRGPNTGAAPGNTPG